MAAERTQADDIIDLIKQQGEMMKGMLDVMMYQQKSKEDGSQKMLGRKKLEGNLTGKDFTSFTKFQGGDTEWVTWAEDFKILVDTKSETVGDTLSYIRRIAKGERDVLP